MSPFQGLRLLCGYGHKVMPCAIEARPFRALLDASSCSALSETATHNVVEAEEADANHVGVDDGEDADLGGAIFHEAEGVVGEEVRGGDDGVACHEGVALEGGEFCVIDFLDGAAEVAVCDDAEEVLVVVYDVDCAEAAARDGGDDFEPRGFGADGRIARFAVHQVCDAQGEAFAELACRMIEGEVVRSESFDLHQGHGERVANDESDGGARRRCEVERASFLVHRGV